MKSVAAAALLMCSLLAAPAFAKDEAKKDAPKPINKLCPVEKGEVDPSVTLEHDGKTIGFCCAGCDTEFKKDPAKYMAIIVKEDAPAKDAAKDAKKDDKKKDENPKKEAELNKTCPVTDDEADKSLTHDHKGRKIAFCCEGCIDDFKKDPKKYLAKLDKAEKDKAGDKKKDDAAAKDGKSK